MAIGLVGVIALLGCGGGGGDDNGNGGGGGTTLGACGSPEGSTTPVVCGAVKDDGGNPVQGVEVILRSSSGAELKRTTTLANGTFKFNPATNGTQLEVAPPSTSYWPTMVSYGGAVYDYDLPNKAGTGKCYLATGVTSGDRYMGVIRIFSNASPPPPPTGGCPR